MDNITELVCFSDKLREHVLRVHAKTTSPSGSNSAIPEESHKSSMVEITSIKQEEFKYIDDAKLEPESDHVCEDESSFAFEHGLQLQPCAPSDTGAPMQSEADDCLENYEIGGDRFHPKVPPTEYQRFIYKCHDCRLGFKRRGLQSVLFVLF